MKFKGVEIDDYVEEDGGIWSQLCDKHYLDMMLSGVNSMTEYPSGAATCGVKGCDKTAVYYIDFPTGEIKE